MLSNMTSRRLPSPSDPKPYSQGLELNPNLSIAAHRYFAAVSRSDGLATAAKLATSMIAPAIKQALWFEKTLINVSPDVSTNIDKERPAPLGEAHSILEEAPNRKDPPALSICIPDA